MRITTIGAGVFAVAALSTIVLTPGVAAADDYAGQKYSDVMSKLGDSDLTGVIATRAGDLVDDDDCVVSSSEKAPWIKGDDFAPVTDTVLVNLNCNAAVATATKSGNSAASPAGRAALKEAKEAKEAKSGQ